MAQKVGRGIALLLHDRGTRRGECTHSVPSLIEIFRVVWNLYADGLTVFMTKKKSTFFDFVFKTVLK